MIDLSIKNSIAHLVLTDPPANTMTLSFFDELNFIATKKLPSLSVKALFIYGISRHFSSGAEPNELISTIGTANNRDNFLNKNIDTFIKLETLPYTKIAIINGCCFGSALELALTCDYRVASKRAIFSFPESEFGLMPGCGGSVRATELISKPNAIELMLSGKTFSSEEAKKIGIIDIIGEKKELQNIAEKLI